MPSRTIAPGMITRMTISPDLTAAAAPTLAGPWERYFARSIDLMIILSVLLTGTYLVLPWISPKLALDLYFVDPAAMTLLLLPLGLFINATIITLFGNSLGKAIFAIKAEPVDGRRRFGFAGNLMREFRVWTQGLALGLPLVSLFTLIPAYRAVNRGKPAGYDIGRATVRAHSKSQLRSTLGILLGMSLYLGIFALNATGRTTLEALEQPSTWFNPVTQRAATIPAGWQYEAVPAAGGASLLHSFTNMKTGLAAVFAVENQANVDMATYTAALSRVLSTSIAFGDWSMSDLPGVWTASGQVAPEGYPSTAYVGQNANQFWRVIYIDQLSKSPRRIVEPELSGALFGSAGIGIGG